MTSGQSLSGPRLPETSPRLLRKITCSNLAKQAVIVIDVHSAEPGRSPDERTRKGKTHREPWREGPPSRRQQGASPLCQPIQSPRPRAPPGGPAPPSESSFLG